MLKLYLITLTIFLAKAQSKQNVTDIIPNPPFICFVPCPSNSCCTDEIYIPNYEKDACGCTGSCMSKLYITYLIFLYILFCFVECKEFCNRVFCPVKGEDVHPALISCKCCGY